MEVLQHSQIEKKIQRLAYQIYEAFIDEKELILAGINGNGYALAAEICKALSSISPLQCTLLEIHLNKTEPSASGTRLSPEGYDLKGKPVLIVDDVLNTGRTMVYAVSAFIREGSSLVRTLVLADRNHRRFPVAADYVGISMATTLQEHLEFRIDNGTYSLQLQ